MSVTLLYQSFSMTVLQWPLSITCELPQWQSVQEMFCVSTKPEKNMLYNLLLHFLNVEAC